MTNLFPFSAAVALMTAGENDFCTYASVMLLMTSNQTYGSHYGRAQSNKKQAIGRTTLDFLVKSDHGNYVHTQ